MLQLDRATFGRLLGFAAVSGVTVTVTLATLIAASAGLGWPGVPSNLLAVTAGGIVSYVGNRRFVWGKRGPNSWRREIAPFWVLTLIGLGVSTGLVAVADAMWGTTVAITAANLTGYGLVWFGKFLAFDRWVFGVDHDTEDRTAATA